MRVIGGEFRSRKIESVPGIDVRPTPDRLRESLFNILAPELQGAVFVDAYAGSGSVGIEAISRGARKAVFIERSKTAVEVLRRNLVSIKAMDRASIVQAKAASAIAGYAKDAIVFLDPPYPEQREYEASISQLGEARLVIAQHASRFAIPESIGVLRRHRVVRQGDNSLSFYSP